MLVVSDTSPVTALLQIGKADLLPALFDRVLIPPAVLNELLRFHASLPDYLAALAI
jgi:predicted nucleic acid-binding protein